MLTAVEANMAVACRLILRPPDWLAVDYGAKLGAAYTTAAAFVRPKLDYAIRASLSSLLQLCGHFDWCSFQAIVASCVGSLLL